MVGISVFGPYIYLNNTFVSTSVKPGFRVLTWYLEKSWLILNKEFYSLLTETSIKSLVVRVVSGTLVPTEVKSKFFQLGRDTKVVQADDGVGSFRTPCSGSGSSGSSPPWFGLSRWKYRNQGCLQQNDPEPERTSESGETRKTT